MKGPVLLKKDEVKIDSVLSNLVCREAPVEKRAEKQEKRETEGEERGREREGLAERRAEKRGKREEGEKQLF